MGETYSKWEDWMLGRRIQVDICGEIIKGRITRKGRWDDTTDELAAVVRWEDDGMEAWISVNQLVFIDYDLQQELNTKIEITQISIDGVEYRLTRI